MAELGLEKIKEIAAIMDAAADLPQFVQVIRWRPPHGHEEGLVGLDAGGGLWVGALSPIDGVLVWSRIRQRVSE